jgi:hypothetical protein
MTGKEERLTAGRKETINKFLQVYMHDTLAASDDKYEPVMVAHVIAGMLEYLDVCDNVYTVDWSDSFSIEVPNPFEE